MAKSSVQEKQNRSKQMAYSNLKRIQSWWEVVQSKEVAGEETEILCKTYMRCHPMKERSAEEAPDANVPRTDSALPLCIAISLLQKES